MFHQNTTLKEVVCIHPELITVLERLQLSQELNATIADAGKGQNFNSEFLLTALSVYTGNTDSLQREFASYPLRFILNYLHKTHRYYLEKKFPEIEQSFLHLYIHYKDTHPLLVILSNFFLVYKEELIRHIENEEMKLFPYIQKLLNAKSNGFKCNTILALTKKYSIKNFMSGHTDMESDLKEIRQLILQHTPIYPTPFPYRIFLIQLQSFEEDMHIHHLIEEEVLVPRARRLEKELIDEADLCYKLLTNEIIYS